MGSGERRRRARRSLHARRYAQRRYASARVAIVGCAAMADDSSSDKGMLGSLEKALSVGVALELETCKCELCEQEVTESERARVGI